VTMRILSIIVLIALGTAFLAVFIALVLDRDDDD
jgi:hypothetical protein